MTPLLPRRATIVCAVLSITGVLFAAITGGLIIAPVRTAVAFLALLLGTVALTSLAPVFDLRPTPPPAAPAAAPPAPGPAAHGGMHALLEQLYPDTPAEPGPVVPEPLHPAGAGTRELRLVDLNTGELVGDRVARLEERVDSLTREVVDLGAVVERQAELTAKAFSTLRREVERIDTTFPAAEEGPDAAA